MSSSVYLQSSDYAAFGVPSATADQVATASTLIDAYLCRSEGLIWVPDAKGLPAYMKALDPTFSFQLPAAISPGQNVPVDAGALAAVFEVGDVVVLDRTVPTAIEACVIASITGTILLLQQVLFAHSSSATVESDLVIKEQRRIPDGRPLCSASRRPLMRLIAGTGRYGYGRRGDANRYNLEDFNLIASLQKFGGPPAWELFNVTAAGFDAATGNVWVPAGILLAYYTEVKLRYVAGYQYANLPAVVKSACATLVQAVQSTPEMGDMKKYRAGDTEIERFSASQLNPDTRRKLDPFRISAFV
ncbi:hypothetical protein RA280_15360 [Cupriavidus sp. CV2]|uniref:hypothetical protein n=1 Tax=Cupriavidus ulmosensis TaxID=3065913 RepID=UPI00296AAB9D|nr:hypothetical protein [Cupriavidus sp. CV2]MDW3683103.1 hypothetical protein [Cupriavidus sp. CV2]